MRGSHFSPAFSKAAIVALAWLPAVAVVSAHLNGAVTANLMVTVLLLCALATLGIVVMYPPTGDEPLRRPASPAEPAPEDRVSASEARAADIRSIIDASDEPVLATDGAGAVVLANRAAAAFFDRSEQRIAGLLIEDLFSQAEILGLHGAAMAGARRGAQVRIARAGGVRIFQVLAAPLPLAPIEGGGADQDTASRRGVVLTLRDTSHDRVDVSAFGILAFLRKPFRLQQLEEALTSAGWTS